MLNNGAGPAATASQSNHPANNFAVSFTKPVPLFHASLHVSGIEKVGIVPGEMPQLVEVATDHLQKPAVFITFKTTMDNTGFVCPPPSTDTLKPLRQVYYGKLFNGGTGDSVSTGNPQNLPKPSTSADERECCTKQTAPGWLSLQCSIK